MGTKSNGHGSTNTNIGIERPLPVKLTKEELLERGDRMAECEIEIEALKVERSGFNRAIKEKVDRRAELAHVIDTGEEKRDVLCKWGKNFPQNCWDLIRQDTKEVVDTRPMSPADRQAEIEFPSEPEPVAELDEQKVDMPQGGAPAKTPKQRKAKVTKAEAKSSKPKNTPPSKPRKGKFALTAV